MIEALLEGVQTAGARCLDFGCGEGVMLERLAARGADVRGVDADSDASG